ncbi:hypothetical protein BDV95DRAFT_607793 [Massariosphaeria phaeospora]|uniref:Uncharacterized protein n=1 Tax=Massariosphaeria phaeospora TaxID=100035 RepID=A0A7C8MAQ9_9PLEO|nr:hypothetical protein BDV95DRAFT_607793 [Massariosphaeria phaeospora]
MPPALSNEFVHVPNPHYGHYRQTKREYCEQFGRVSEEEFAKLWVEQGMGEPPSQYMPMITQEEADAYVTAKIARRRAERKATRTAAGASRSAQEPSAGAGVTDSAQTIVKTEDIGTAGNSAMTIVKTEDLGAAEDAAMTVVKTEDVDENTAMAIKEEND